MGKFVDPLMAADFLAELGVKSDSVEKSVESIAR